MKLHFYLTDNPSVELNVAESQNVYTLPFPCASSFSCSNYFSSFPPGFYKIELYGASGGHAGGYVTTATTPDQNFICPYQNDVLQFGGNTVCKKIASCAGAGGYTSGVLHLKSMTRVFISIGGKGEYSSGSISYLDKDRPRGGYNGGGKASRDPGGSSGGGGATDFRVGSDDYWHRILVAGGGGGSDNPGGSFRGSDDGSGGAGGGVEAQGFWIDGVYYSSWIATQSSGFSFGNGEAAQQVKSINPAGKSSGNLNDRAGAGGGWYGGFSSHNGQGGSGGGSSFALTKSSQLPSGSIPVYNEYYTFMESRPYAFSNSSEYALLYHSFSQGIWDGDGFARITFTPFHYLCTHQRKHYCACNLLLFKILLFSGYK